MKKVAIILSIYFGAICTSLFAGEADVNEVNIIRNANGSFNFDVTIFHNDTGWDHYADKWDILNEQGTVIATRILLHPHVGEQPFTRSLTHVRIPNDVKQIIVRAHDLIHGYGGKTVQIKLP